MKYIVDNDLHIHSEFSLCSNDKEQNKHRILRYAVENGLKTVCVTDHFWDSSIKGEPNEFYEDFYAFQDFERLNKNKPLPQADGVRFLFGCEAELDKNLNLSIPRKRFDDFDFVVIPTTHFHMKELTLLPEDYQNSSSRANAWIKRLDAVLNMDIPFHKVGIAHLTCSKIAPQKTEILETLSKISNDDLVRLFTKAAKLGVGIELNFDFSFVDDEAEVVLRPYRIAKECGCKFYLGSDAHHPEKFEGITEEFKRIVDALKLTEDDKFMINLKEDF